MKIHWINTKSKMRKDKLYGWFLLARPPFHSVGVLPFLLGTLLARNLTGKFNLAVLGWGTLAVVLIMLLTYYLGEYFDYQTDALSAKMEKNRFSGGSQVLQAKIVSRKHVFIAALICLAFAAGIGILLQFHHKTGPYTIPLGAVGAFAGFFYSAKPIQWAYRGIGEVWVGFCYGWLAVATAYYLQTGELTSLVHWTALPISLSIFNVILINEFPDYPADRKAGKRTLVVLFGKKKMSMLYILVSAGVWGSYFLTIKAGFPVRAIFFFAPVFFISILATLQILRGDYKDKKKLEGICAKTIIVNLGTTASFILTIL